MNKIEQIRQELRTSEKKRREVRANFDRMGLNNDRKSCST